MWTTDRFATPVNRSIKSASKSRKGDYLTMMQHQLMTTQKQRSRGSNQGLSIKQSTDRDYNFGEPQHHYYYHRSPVTTNRKISENMSLQTMLPRNRISAESERHPFTQTQQFPPKPPTPQNRRYEDQQHSHDYNYNSQPHLPNQPRNGLAATATLDYGTPKKNQEVSYSYESQGINLNNKNALQQSQQQLSPRENGRIVPTLQDLKKKGNPFKQHLENNARKYFLALNSPNNKQPKQQGNILQNFKSAQQQPYIDRARITSEHQLMQQRLQNRNEYGRQTNENSYQTDRLAKNSNDFRLNLPLSPTRKLVEPPVLFKQQPQRPAMSPSAPDTGSNNVNSSINSPLSMLVKEFVPPSMIPVSSDESSVHQITPPNRITKPQQLVTNPKNQPSTTAKSPLVSQPVPARQTPLIDPESVPNQKSISNASAFTKKIKGDQSVSYINDLSLVSVSQPKKVLDTTNNNNNKSKPAGKSIYIHDADSVPEVKTIEAKPAPPQEVRYQQKPKPAVEQVRYDRPVQTKPPTTQNSNPQSSRSQPKPEPPKQQLKPERELFDESLEEIQIDEPKPPVKVAQPAKPIVVNQPPKTQQKPTTPNTITKKEPPTPPVSKGQSVKVKQLQPSPGTSKMSSNMQLGPNQFAEILEVIEQHVSLIDILGQYTKKAKNFFKGFKFQWELVTLQLYRKFYFQRTRVVKALKGKGENPFTLEDLQIEDYQLQECIKRPEFIEYRQELQQQVPQIVQCLAGFLKKAKEICPDGVLTDSINKDPYDQVRRQLAKEYRFLETSIKSGLKPDALNSFKRRQVYLSELFLLLQHFQGDFVKQFEEDEQIEDADEYLAQYGSVIQDIIK